MKGFRILTQESDGAYVNTHTCIYVCIYKSHKSGCLKRLQPCLVYTALCALLYKEWVGGGLLFYD